MAVSVLGVIALLALLVVPHPRQALDLPDGSRITFKGADFGKTHTYPPNARLLKALFRYLPNALTSKLGVPQDGHAIGQDSIYFWYRQDRSSNQPARLERVLVDDAGVESAVIAYGCSQQLPGGSNLEGCGATVWPRRSFKVGLRFYLAEGTNRLVKVGEFWTRNPHRVDAAQWTPAALPVTRGTDALGITLAGVEYGRLPSAQAEEQQGGGYLRFRLTWKGKPTTAWQIRLCSLEDAGGNHLNLWEQSLRVEDEEILPLRGRFQDGSESAVLPYTLWPGETAWRIRVVASPRADAQFSSDELGVFRALPVPKPDAAFALSAATNVNGVIIKLDSICGKGFDPSGEAHKFPNSEVLVTAETLCNDRAPVIVRVVDDAGRTIAVGPSDTFSRQVGANSWRTFTGTPLIIPPDSGALEITFGVTTNRSAVFLAQPPQFPNSGGSKK